MLNYTFATVYLFYSKLFYLIRCKLLSAAQIKNDLFSTNADVCASIVNASNYCRSGDVSKLYSIRTEELSQRRFQHFYRSLPGCMKISI